MSQQMRRLIVGGLQFGGLYLVLGAIPAIQAVLLGMISLALLGILLTVVFGLIYVLWSKKVGSLWPALVATFVRVGDRYWAIVGAGVIISAFCVPGISKMTFQLPEWNSAAARVGAALGAFACVTYFSELAASLGFPPGLKPRPRFQVSIRFRYIGLILAVGTAFPAALTPRFQHAAVPVLFSAAVYTLFAVAFSRRLALMAFLDVPPVEGTTPPLLGEDTPYLIHTTDIHLVAQGATRIEGGAGGSKGLENLVARAKARPPALLLITGDLTDHGSPSEYDEANRIIDLLQSCSQRTVVLFAPGNHDLGTAYTGTSQLMAIGSSLYSVGSRTGTDGLLLVRYLEEAARMHPALEDCTGKPLKDWLDRNTTRDAEFEAVLAQVRERIRERPLDATALSELAAAGERSYPGGQPLGGWHMLLRHRGFFREIYLASWYAALWYDAFPLRVEMVEESTDILILNSVSPDPTLGGSAWGELGEEQMQRLTQMMKTSRARRFLILVHHAPFRWKDERSPKLTLTDLQRWGFLAFSADDLRGFVSVLRESVAAGKEVFLFCGHRHGFKKDPSGRTVAPVCRWGTLEGITVAEGASLADTGTAVIAAVADQDGLRLRSLAA